MNDKNNVFNILKQYVAAILAPPCEHFTLPSLKPRI